LENAALNFTFQEFEVIMWALCTADLHAIGGACVALVDLELSHGGQLRGAGIASLTALTQLHLDRGTAEPAAFAPALAALSRLRSLALESSHLL